MSTTLRSVQMLVKSGDVRISEHGYDEMAADGISVEIVLAGIDDAMIVEDYPSYPKGPCVLVLEHDNERCPIHVVWGIPRGHFRPAVLVTAYRPDTRLWDSTFMRRRT